MASVFYGIDFETTVAEMRKQMASFPLTRIDEAKYLIRSFVTYMADKVHKDRAIDTFVLLVDEALAMEKHILERYPDCTDITSCVRTALLNEDILFNGGAMKTALAISSLSINPIQQTTSSRAVEALVLPSTLNKTLIVTEIWNKGNRTYESPQDLYRLELIAATVNNLPRLVEIVENYIKSMQTVTLSIDKKFVKGLYLEMGRQLASRYSRAGKCPSDQLLGALIFGDGVNLDGDTVKCITHSLITNCIVDFAEDQRLDEPEMSLALMQHYTSMGKTQFAKAISGGIAAIIDAITDDEDEGHLWEIAYYEWMKIRLQAASCYVPNENVPFDQKIMKIMKLFGITQKSIVPDAHLDMLLAPLGLPNRGVPSWREYNLTNSSYKKPKSFLKEIDNIALSAQSPIAILRPVKGDAFDLCLKILVPGYDEPMHVFVENKAMKESNETASRVLYDINKSKDKIAVEDFKSKGRQYIQTETVMADRKIVYIYARTQKSVSYGINNAIELGRDDSFGFLGPLSDLYQTAKSTSTPKGK